MTQHALSARRQQVLEGFATLLLQFFVTLPKKNVDFEIISSFVFSSQLLQRNRSFYLY